MPAALDLGKALSAPLISALLTEAGFAPVLGQRFFALHPRRTGSGSLWMFAQEHLVIFVGGRIPQILPTRPIQRLGAEKPASEIYGNVGTETKPLERATDQTTTASLDEIDIPTINKFKLIFECFRFLASLSLFGFPL
jgi:hypothetical protein